ncbi:MAG TPA: hypothetical protein VHN73_00605 [Phenylobacterium sp.]|nr:hypothetical protein [Phenylobacterium sp.]
MTMETAKNAKFAKAGRRPVSRNPDVCGSHARLGELGVLGGSVLKDRYAVNSGDQHV